jgi:cobalt ECF transporter T component CbiQ
VTRRHARGYLERTIDSLLIAIERTQRTERSAEARGLLQRIDPRVKVAGLLGLIAAVVFSRHAGPIGAVLAMGLVAALASRVSLEALVAGVWLEAFLFTGAIAAPALVLTPGRPAFPTSPLPWPVITVQGLTAAGYLLLRVETAATLAYLLVATTPWMHVLKALRIFRVPVVFVVVLGMTYRYILLMLEAAREMFEARRARAVTRPQGRMAARQAAASAAVLLSRTVALSGEVYLAMLARGFRGEVHVLDDFRMRPIDWAALSSFAAIAAAAVWAGR